MSRQINIKFTFTVHEYILLSNLICICNIINIYIYIYIYIYLKGREIFVILINFVCSFYSYISEATYLKLVFLIYIYIYIHTYRHINFVSFVYCKIVATHTHTCTHWSHWFHSHIIFSSWFYLIILTSRSSLPNCEHDPSYQ